MKQQGRSLELLAKYRTSNQFDLFRPPKKVLVLLPQAPADGGAANFLNSRERHGGQREAAEREELQGGSRR